MSCNWVYSSMITKSYITVSRLMFCLHVYAQRYMPLLISTILSESCSFLASCHVAIKPQCTVARCLIITHHLTCPSCYCIIPICVYWSVHHPTWLIQGLCYHHHTYHLTYPRFMFINTSPPPHRTYPSYVLIVSENST